MKIHEFQAKKLLADFGVPVPRGRVASTPEEARGIVDELGAAAVVKAQVHAGGRGKGGGIKMAKTADEAERVAGEILGMQLVTPQTGEEGKLVRRVLVEEQTDVQRELYLSLLIDGATGHPTMIASSAGGMEIEEVAADRPEAIHRVAIDPAAGFQPHIGRQLAFALGLEGDLLRPAVELMSALYRCFVEKDCSLVEINPLVVDASGRLLALDAKVTFDDNALFRHEDIAAMRDPEEEDPLEVEAQEMGVGGYVKLDGNIGCVVNGAGLAMATMDSIKLAGGEPANFFDIGTVNDPARVVNAFRILTKDASVKAVLINIFGGMARVDVIAQGVVDAHKELDIGRPVVVRLAGTNVEDGERILKESGLPVVRAADLGEAARAAVEAAGKAG
ncbi:MAG: ADP-forming succinate--CoA ligase subunit beta [Chloroflexi bacterium]|nr:ADP-forming succinate--CoA ligase subunit beta [Chloroflexota bacterium]